MADLYRGVVGQLEADRQRLLDLQQEIFARSCQRDFLLFCETVLGRFGQTPAAHHQRIISELEGLARGNYDRLLMTAPPGSAKSTYTARLFPAWMMCRQPAFDVIGASNVANFAEMNSGRVQDILREFPEIVGCTLASESKQRWGLDNRSQYRAAGVGGTITGARADLVVIDDPISGREDADSLAQRIKLQDWYHSELVRRLKPGGRVAIIMTRWHEDDIAGRLLRAEPGRWRVLRLPAIAEENDPLGRAPGEPLWADDPDYGYARDLAGIHEELRSAGLLRDWHALYQGDPRPPEGAMFLPGKIPLLDFVLDHTIYDRARGWDFAASVEGDWTVGIKMVSLNGSQGVDYAIVDCQRFRGRPDEVFRTVHALAESDGLATRIYVPQDPGSAGIAESEAYIRALAGFSVTAERMSGDKATRAFGVAAQVNIGKVGMLKAPWTEDLLDEMASFPLGQHDDQIDALALAFTHLAKPNLAAWMKL